MYDDAEAERIRGERGWTLARDGDHWRRVVASPRPKRVLELEAIRTLLERGVIVICAGGGGVPTIRREGGRLEGVEAVIDKDRASALLARDLGAEVLALATDVDAVYTGWGAEGARPIGRTTPAELRALAFEPGSMGPKVEAACEFVEGGRGGSGAPRSHRRPRRRGRDGRGSRRDPGDTRDLAMRPSYSASQRRAIVHSPSAAGNQ